MVRTEGEAREGVAGFRPFPMELLAGSAERAARDLLGSLLVSTAGGHRTVGRVVETEAYIGPDDPASHAAARIGRTRRNAAMFGPPGTAYVYRIYGLHWCLNVVTGDLGHPAAVLIRAIEPLAGQGTMARRRGRDGDLGSGPGRLCQAMGVDGSLDGHDLTLPPLHLAAGVAVPDEGVAVTGRIGIREARDWPLRFLIRGDPHVSGRIR